MLSEADSAAGWVMEDGTGKKKAPIVKAVVQQPEAPVETKLTVEVPAKKIGLLIGPKGSTLMLIQNKTETKIDIPERDRESTLAAKVAVTGEAEACKLAKGAIEDLCTKGYSAMLMGEDFVESTIDVHPSYIHMIVGPKGKTIIAIRETTGATLNIPEDSRNSNARRIKVSVAGPKASVAMAKDVVNALMRVYHHELTHPGMTHVELEIPYEYYSVVIGPRGSEIKHIQANFKVDVNIPNENTLNEKIVIVGPKLNVLQADKYIKKIVQNAIERPSAAQADAVDDDDSNLPYDDESMEYMYKRPGNSSW